MPQGTVVVTGASTGIGRVVVRRLASVGFDVLAGVRKDADAEALRQDHPRIEPVTLDVTNAEQIEALQERIGDRPLAGLVNNAGVAFGGPLEGIPLDRYRALYEVNVFGLVAVTQALLPALRQAQGRIANIGSIGGRIHTPFVSPYSSSKAAVRSLSFSLRRELRPWGIAVALVEPGALDTPIWAKGESASDDTIQALPERVRSLYARQLEALREGIQRAAEHAEPADLAADAVEHALTADRPRPVYTVGRLARLQGVVSRLLPPRAMDAAVTRAMRLPR